MHYENEFFHTAPDCVDHSDMSLCIRMIRYNSETREYELVSNKHKPGQVGEKITDTITFDDPATFGCAIGQLETIGTAVVTGSGKIRHVHHLWNKGENEEGSADITEDEVRRGMITCVLHVKNGVLAPFTPKIEKVKSD